MDGEARALAPAKVNLHLAVGARRADGFHDLLSLFQAVDLYDAVTVQVGAGAGATTVAGDFSFPPEENIVTQAVDLFRSETGLRGGVVVTVEKRVPIGAGLGGGSSDAAATLRCLRALCAPDLPGARLAALAASLGSDVPFFLGSAAALVEGRGERVTPIRPRTDFAIAAVVPDARTSTAEAYAALDAVRPGAGSTGEAARIVADYHASPVGAWSFSNSFDAVGMEGGAVREARGAFADAGAAGIRLTGSGSTLIAVFDDAEGARRCVERARVAGLRSLLLRPLATIPPVW